MVGVEVLIRAGDIPVTMAAEEEEEVVEILTNDHVSVVLVMIG